MGIFERQLGKTGRVEKKEISIRWWNERMEMLSGARITYFPLFSSTASRPVSNEFLPTTERSVATDLRPTSTTNLPVNAQNFCGNQNAQLTQYLAQFFFFRVLQDNIDVIIPIEYYFSFFPHEISFLQETKNNTFYLAYAEFCVRANLFCT